MADIFIVDDHPMLRRGLMQLFELEDDLHVVADFSDAEGVLEASLALDPDLILLDLNMPKINGIQLLTQLRSAGVSSRIIMFTVSDEQNDIYRAIQAGADGYLLKDTDPEDFIESVKHCVAGNQVVSGSISEMVSHALANRMPTDIHPLLAELTDRERDVLRTIADGLSNKEIGRTLGIAEGTVKVHVKRVLFKLGLRSRVEAAIFAHEHAGEF